MRTKIRPALVLTVFRNEPFWRMDLNVIHRCLDVPAGFYDLGYGFRVERPISGQQGWPTHHDIAKAVPAICTEPSCKAHTRTFDTPPMEINMASKTAKTAQEILMDDFQTLVSDTERLLEHTATLAGDQADELREQIHESLLRARETLQLTQESLTERGKAAVTATEDYVQANPWQSVGIAAGVGFLIGLLATRR